MKNPEGFVSGQGEKYFPKKLSFPLVRPVQRAKEKNVPKILGNI